MLYLACGLVVWVLRPDGPLGATFLGMGASWAFFLLTAMDLYGPATFFRLHVPDRNDHSQLLRKRFEA